MIVSLLLPFLILLFLSYKLLEKFQSMKGKSILILGPNCAGKTTLLKYLVENKIIKNYIRSAIVEQEKLKKIKISNGIEITTAIAMTGDEVSIKSWKEEIVKCDYLIYLISLKRIVNDSLGIDKTRCKEELPIDKLENYKQRVLSDLKIIKEHLQGLRESKVFILAFNFADCFSFYFKDKFEFEQKIQRIIDEFIIAAGGGNIIKCVIGSLADETEAQKFWDSILVKIKEAL